MSRGKSRKRQRNYQSGNPRWVVAALGAAGVLVVALAAVALNPGLTPDSSYDMAQQASVLEPAAPAPIPLAVFLGDSFVEGSQVSLPERFPFLLGATKGWQVDSRGEGGTGYVTDGPAEYPERSPFPGRVQGVIDAKPDIVIVAGGLNDTGPGYGDQQLTDAITNTLSPLRLALPDAQIVVVGPLWPNGFPPDSAIQVRDRMSAVASSLDLQFIDPIAELWFTGSRDGTTTPGNRTQFILADGTHPNAAGHRYIAERLAADIGSAD